MMEFFTNFWLVVEQMSPYLLLGFAMAGALSVLIPTRWIETHLGGEGAMASLKASAFGVPLPICSCGVIPLSASLRQHGAGQGPTTAFLISTPQTGVDSILVTYSLLGPVFAIYRPVVALLSGLLGGALISTATRRDAAKGVASVDKTGICCGQNGQGHAENHVHDQSCPANQAASSCEDSCCEGHDHDHSRDVQNYGHVLSVWQKTVQACRYGFVTLPADLSRSLLLGLAISAMISAFLPANFFTEELGLTSYFSQMLVMMVVGIPMYVCSTASIPIAASLVVHAGVTPGAALVFLIVGPATNAATITTIVKMMGRRTVSLYLLAVAFSAFVGGYGLDLVGDWVDFMPTLSHKHEMSSWWETASAISLVLLLVYAMARPWLARWRKHAHDSDVEGVQQQRLRFSVDGMTCQHCGESIRRVLLATKGVQQVDVDLHAGEVVVTGQAMGSTEFMLHVIAELGFSGRLERQVKTAAGSSCNCGCHRG